MWIIKLLQFSKSLSWNMRAVISIFVEIANNTCMAQNYTFFFMQKSLDIKIMFHEDICTVNISKLNFWLLICIAKNFIWTTLKMIFLIFDFFSPSDFPILSYHNKPYINGNIIYSAFRWCINLNLKMHPYDWFCAPGSRINNNIQVILDKCTGPEGGQLYWRAFARVKQSVKDKKRLTMNWSESFFLSKTKRMKIWSVYVCDRSEKTREVDLYTYSLY